MRVEGKVVLEEFGTGGLFVGWLRCDAEHPCSVCESPNYCLRSNNGRDALCMRQTSDRPYSFSNGWEGWIHAEANPQGHREPSRRPAPKISAPDVKRIAKEMFKHPMASGAREAMAATLGVSVEALELLRMGYGEDGHGQFASFPMRNSKLEIVGLSRRYSDGSKLSGFGMQVGVFCELEWSKRPGPVLIVEGASDVAAAISMGLPALGRFNNMAGAELIGPMLGGRPAFVIGENDEKPDKRGTPKGCKADCSGCLQCFPGREAAKVVAKKINRPWVMPPAGLKDIREVVSAGLSWPELIRGLTWGAAS